MKKNFVIQSIRCDKKYDRDTVSWNFVPVSRAIRDLNKLELEYNTNHKKKVKVIFLSNPDREKAVVEIGGKTAAVDDFIKTITNESIMDYFTIQAARDFDLYWGV